MCLTYCERSSTHCSAGDCDAVLVELVVRTVSAIQYQPSAVMPPAKVQTTAAAALQLQYTDGFKPLAWNTEMIWALNIPEAVQQILSVATGRIWRSLAFW